MNTNLNPEQLAAATSPHRLTLVASTAGSGKTRTLAARADHWLAQGVPASRIAALTFTNEAASVLQARINTDAPLGYVGTLHGLLLSYLRTFAPDLAVISSEDADELLEEIGNSLKFKGKKDDLPKARRHFWEFAGGLTPRDMTPELRTVQMYYQRLTRENLIDFDGLLWRGLATMIDSREHMSITVRDRLKMPWTHFLIDEIQDAAKVDYAIYRQLELAGCHIFAVGDENQSIFSFRGAHPEGMKSLGVARHGEIPSEWNVYELASNYRSARKIIDASNRLISHNVNRIDFAAVGVRDEPGKVVLHEESNVGMHDLLIQTLICNAYDSGIPHEEIAVLCRTNRIASEMRAVVESVAPNVATENKIDLPHDWPLLKRALACMASPASWFAYERWVAAYSKTFGLNESARAAGVSRKAAGTTPPLTADVKSYGNARLAVAQLFRYGVSNSTVSLVADWLDAHPCDTVSALMLGLAQDYVSTRSGSGVYVGTAHSAKGMEFACVIVAACEVGQFPLKNFTGDALEEERRLLYVACTRAKDELHIVSAKRRPAPYGKGLMLDTGLSPFAREIFQGATEL